MRVGVCVENADKLAGGGYNFEQSILETLNKMSNLKHEFFVISKNNLNKHIAYKEKKFLFIKYKKKVKSESLNPLVKEKNLDLIWFLTPFAYVPVDTTYIATMWDLAHRIHPYFPEVSVFGSYEYRERLYSEMLPKASIIVTGNDVGKKQIMQFYGVPAERIKSVAMSTSNYVFNKYELNENILAKYNIKEPFLFYPAQFWAHKNHVNLLLMLKELKEKYNQDFSLVLTGSDQGNLNFVKNKVKELNLEQNVHFLGFVKVEEVIMLYKKAFCLVFPSFFGPDNLPPLEAMALSCPVVASNIEGHLEQLKDCALYFDLKSPEDMALKVMKLKNNQDLRQNLIEKGQNLAKSRTTQNYITEIIKILDDFESIRRNWGGI